jgi:hypothetical protein
MNPFHQALAEPPEAQVEIWLLAMEHWAKSRKVLLWILARNLFETAVISALNERAAKPAAQPPV